MTINDLGADKSETRQNIANKLASAINTFNIQNNGQLGISSAHPYEEGVDIIKVDANTTITIVAAAVNGTGNPDDTQA